MPDKRPENPDEQNVLEAVLEELRGLRKDVAGVRVSHWFNVTAALACIACLVTTAVAVIQADNAQETAKDTSSQLAIAREQLRRQIESGEAAVQVNTQIGCTLGEIVINASRVPRDDEDRGEFLTRLQTYARLLRQLRQVDCDVPGGIRPFEERRQESLDDVERILQAEGVPTPSSDNGGGRNPDGPNPGVDPSGPAAGPGDKPTRPTRPEQPTTPSEPEPTDPGANPPDPETPAPETGSGSAVGETVEGVGGAVDEALKPVCGVARLPLACP